PDSAPAAAGEPARAGEAPILITGGDPAGVAPELLLALVEDLHPIAAATAGGSILYFATAGTRHIQEFVELCARRNLPARLLAGAESPQSEVESGISVIDMRLGTPGAEAFAPRPGQPDATGGRLAFAALAAACDFATLRVCRGIVTAPLSKEWVALGGAPDFRGHTEYLAARFQRDVIMLMHGRRFSVIPLTVHIALVDAPGALRERLADPGLPELLEQVLAGSAYAGGRIAMCGLNPHCGDGGLFGREDLEFVGDWCAAMRARGIPLDGPLPADTLFMDGVRERYRLILSCYHDQGLIPFKALEGHAGINATIGLPIPRTSPDHGTAFDIAGRGLARVDSLRAAFRAVARGELKL
ncbi:MAG: 4-hydroxythreonine-4-phosphate dehydrogenase PdxA, partial [Leptospirales bacterium]